MANDVDKTIQYELCASNGGNESYYYSQDTCM